MFLVYKISQFKQWIIGLELYKKLSTLFYFFQENEQFRKTEKRRIEREKKEADEKARREKLGIKEKPKGKRRPPPIEEKSIIDNLLDEIKNGFPLRKNQVEQMANQEEKEAPKASNENEKENKEEVVENNRKAKRNWKKTKMLASLIGKLFY